MLLQISKMSPRGSNAFVEDGALVFRQGYSVPVGRRQHTDVLCASMGGARSVCVSWLLSVGLHSSRLCVRVSVCVGVCVTF